MQKVYTRKSMPEAELYAKMINLKNQIYQKVS